MIEALIGQPWPYIITVAGIIAGLFYVRQLGKSAARNEAAAKVNETGAQARKEVRDVENTVARMADSAAGNAALGEWLRSTRFRPSRRAKAALQPPFV